MQRYRNYDRQCIREEREMMNDISHDPKLGLSLHGTYYLATYTIYM